jgi:hypothetical protein
VAPSVLAEGGRVIHSYLSPEAERVQSISTWELLDRHKPRVGIVRFVGVYEPYADKVRGESICAFLVEHQRLGN